MSVHIRDQWKRIANFKKNLPSNRELFESAKFSGEKGISDIVEGKIYLIKGLTGAELDEIKSAVFYNFLTEDIFEDALPVWEGEIIEIAYLPGVMDPVAVTLEKILGDCFRKDTEIQTRKLFLIKGDFDRTNIIKRVLSNPIIEEEVPVGTLPERGSYFHNPVVNRFNIEDRTSKELLEISRSMTLSLSSDEMIEIQKYFSVLRRLPTDAELETIAQTWSEHCVHKTLRGLFHFESEIIDDLLKSTIVKATREIARKDCVSVFKDNAGIVSVDGDTAYCVKVETHNHPSALEPYGGAGTGLGGVVRDILGTGLGAKPVAGIDVFCTGNPDAGYSSLPEGTMHPRRILNGVVSGVRDYGNRIGVPTVSGALVVDDGFLRNPLVFAGCIGVLPVKAANKKVSPGDRIVLVGGKTGRDGLHGATFSSVTLDSESEKKSQGSVQIGNPIEEKKIIEAVIRIREENLLNAVTDCGAGGLSSAVGEMGAETGAIARLENVPLKYEYISPWEIWLSESQERMVLAVPLENIDRVFEICDEEQTNVSVIGEFSETCKLEVYYYEEKIIDLDMKFLHEGVPRRHIKAREKQIPIDRSVRMETDPEKALIDLLSMPDIASKDWIIRQYDHQVQGKTVTGPFSGEKQKSHSDGASFFIDYSKKNCLAVGLGINVNIGKYNCYKMALFSVEEALRNLVCSGGDPSRAVLLDNFSWGSSDDPEAMGDLVSACKACHDASMNYGTPFISGKDSLNNTFKSDGKSVSIPPTLLITCVSVKGDLSPLNSFYCPGDRIYVLGPEPKGLGGSCFEKRARVQCGLLPEIDLKTSKDVIWKVFSNLDSFSSIHDVSEGGLAVSLAEMAIGSGFGAAIVKPSDQDLLDFMFSESPSRFVVTVSEKADVDIFKGVVCTEIGKVLEEPILEISSDKKNMTYDISKLEEAYFSKRL
ncbi:phosphoribosylformylglycinamidine synthase subunit PurL [candidate division WOR-3 bacterium]|nr:phosphoribosylformylglycinamidine synthase subunit PurL [candidate division WOR-3 bacterium]